MKNAPKISIVTPTFNQGQYIEQTILSVLDQGYSNLEYMIIDGGSTDNTVEIIKKYEKYLAFWVSEKDKGQSDAINKGLTKCTGEIFNWINSDDYYEGKVFEKVAAAFEHADTMMFCGSSHVFGGEKEWISEGTRLPDAGAQKWIQPVIDQPATFFRMEMVRKFGPLTQQLHYTMDLDWLLRYWLEMGNKGMVKTSDILVHFREHPNSKTVNFQDRFVDERLELYHDLLLVAGERKGDPVKVDYGHGSVCIPAEWICKTTNEFVYMEMVVAYGQRNFKRFNQLANLLVKKYLDGARQKELKKMSFRAGLLSKLPASFIQKKA